MLKGIMFFACSAVDTWAAGCIMTVSATALPCSHLLTQPIHSCSAVDTWAAGCIMAELLMLRPLFQGEEDKRTPDSFQQDQLDRWEGPVLVVLRCTVPCMVHMCASCGACDARHVLALFPDGCADMPVAQVLCCQSSHATTEEHTRGIKEVHACRIFRVLGHPTPKVWPNLEHHFHWANNTGNIRLRKPDAGSTTLEEVRCSHLCL